MAEAVTRKPILRKQPVSFLERVDFGGNQRANSPTSFPVMVNSIANKDPFADPARNPFDDPLPTVVLVPATPTPLDRNSTSSLLSDSSSREVRQPFSFVSLGLEFLLLA